MRRASRSGCRGGSAPPRTGDSGMNNHVVEFEPGRRIGWEPEDGRGTRAPGAGRWRRWSFELTPDSPEATIVTEICDCCRAPADVRAELGNGSVMIENTTKTLERLGDLCAG